MFTLEASYIQLFKSGPAAQVRLLESVKIYILRLLTPGTCSHLERYLTLVLFTLWAQHKGPHLQYVWYTKARFTQGVRAEKTWGQL
jgi:hypothetical protein